MNFNIVSCTVNYTGVLYKSDFQAHFISLKNIGETMHKKMKLYQNERNKIRHYYFDRKKIYFLK